MEDHALNRIADALEQLVASRSANPENVSNINLNDSTVDAFVWTPKDISLFRPVSQLNAVPFDLLQGLDSQKNQLWQNSLQFAKGHAANNALLWGARGTGKSSLVKAVFQALLTEFKGKIALIEVHREEIESLGDLLNYLRHNETRQFFLFCDDLSFEDGDNRYKSLKAVLEGGIEGKPSNVLFYATSNRRHLLARSMDENEAGSAIHPAESGEEKISLSDRFGLWIGFHHYDQTQYLEIIAAYIKAFSIPVEADSWQEQALQWAMARGARSGRVAYQFIQDLAGRYGQSL